MKKSKTAAVLPSKGIGDALLMMIASHQLLLQGFEVTTFHEKLFELQTWFKEGHRFAKRPDLRDCPQTIKLSDSSNLFDDFSRSSLAAYAGGAIGAKELREKSQKGSEDDDFRVCGQSLKALEEIALNFDLIIIQNDNSENIPFLIQKARSRLSIFYPTYQAYKHAPLFTLDQVFLPNQSMASNIAKGIADLLNISSVSKDNGLTPPSHLVHQKHKTRIILHPTSSEPSKNWSWQSYLLLAKKLQDQNFNPVFVMSKQEQKESSFDLATFQRLDELASFLYESGGMIGNDSLLGHLASNLNIPTIIIAQNQKLLQLWRPDWLKGELVTPPSWIPNLKLLRIREKWWRSFISTKKILKLVEKKF